MQTFPNLLNVLVIISCHNFVCKRYHRKNNYKITFVGKGSRLTFSLILKCSKCGILQLTFPGFWILSIIFVFWTEQLDESRNPVILSEIGGFHSGEDVDCGLWGCATMQTSVLSMNVARIKKFSLKEELGVHEK
jgi:hypothetical protein